MVLGYKVYFNREKWKYQAEDKPSTVGLETDLTLWFDTYPYAKECVDIFNVTRLNRIYKCKDCGEPFYVSPDESEWFTRNGMNVPKRCLSCRHIRKRNN